jgi:two-component system phosphate regulon response regulator OmpR
VSPEPSGQRPDRLLVVDDDARIRQMLARYFEDEGYRVTAVADGSAMRAELAIAAVSLILLAISTTNGAVRLRQNRSRPRANPEE